MTINETIDMRLASRECPECGQRFSRDGVFCPFDGTRLEPLSVCASTDPLIGTTIDGRYEVIELLGEGGMGRVYSVLHSGLGRLFALKALRRELARDEELSQRFIREAKAMASVRHPHIVEITDFGRLPDGVPYFVMEMLVGETLAQVIKANGSVSIDRGVAILEQVASALAAAHESGVVHRDLKPENVFLVGSGPGHVGPDDVRVVDFGAAKIIGSSQVTRNGVVFGTPYYMSPEQASGSSLDTRTDIYSLGIIMYEMFTGKVPFEGDTYMNVLTQHMFAEPEPPSRRSPHGTSLGALDQVALVCMAKRPEKRFATMQEVLSALRSALDGGTVGPPRYAGSGHASLRPGFGDFAPPDEDSGQPSLEDIRRAVEASDRPPPPVPWGWIAVAAVGIGSALATMVWAYGHGTATSSPPVAAASSAYGAVPQATTPSSGRAEAAPRPSAAATAAATMTSSETSAPGMGLGPPSPAPVLSSEVGGPASTHTRARGIATAAASAASPRKHALPIEDDSDPFRSVR